jgi:hypothetical protein
MSLYAEIDIDLDELKEYLKIDTDDQDDTLVNLLKGACNLAEEYIGKDYEDEIIPGSVKVWIMKKVGDDLDNPSVSVKSERLGDYNMDKRDDIDYTDIAHLRISPGL